MAAQHFGILAGDFIRLLDGAAQVFGLGLFRGGCGGLALVGAAVVLAEQIEAKRDQADSKQAAQA